MVPDPNFIQSLKPRTGRCLMPDLALNLPLNIQIGLITTHILAMQPSMRPNRQMNSLPFVPLGAVNVQINPVTPKALVKMTHTFNESFRVAFGAPDHSSPPQHRSHPSQQIELLTMLAGAWSTQAFCDLCPTNPKARMQSKAGFIFKDYAFLTPKTLESFLGRGGTSSPLRPATEDANIRVALAYVLPGASTIAPARRSALFQNSASCESPGGPHATSPNSILTPNLLSPIDFQIPSVPLGSTEQEVPAASRFLPRLDLDHLFGELIDSKSAVLCSGHRQTIPNAAPAPVAVEPESLFPSRLPELPESWTKAALEPPWYASTSTMDFSSIYNITSGSIY
jgi:hypothetical protein